MDFIFTVIGNSLKTITKFTGDKMYISCKLFSIFVNYIHFNIFVGLNSRTF